MCLCKKNKQNFFTVSKSKAWNLMGSSVRIHSFLAHLVLVFGHLDVVEVSSKSSRLQL